MTTKELSQIYWLNKEKKMWQRELARINNRSLVSGQNHTRTTGSSTVGVPEAQATNKDDIENIIRDVQVKIDAEEKRMMEYIQSIEDSLMRQIVHYRCVCLWPWNVIAMEIGGGNTADGIRMKFTRYFREK